MREKLYGGSVVRENFPLGDARQVETLVLPSNDRQRDNEVTVVRGKCTVTSTIHFVSFTA